MSDRHKAIKLWNELAAEWRGKPAKDLSHGWWVSEWSWRMGYDGEYPSYHEKVPYLKFADGLCFYVTNTNNRIYGPWDLCETEDECKSLCERKRNCAYGWDEYFHEMIRQYGLHIEINKAEAYGWFRQLPKVWTFMEMTTWNAFVNGWKAVAIDGDKCIALVRWANDNNENNFVESGALTDDGETIYVNREKKDSILDFLRRKA